MSMLRFAVVCEGRADARTGCLLADRVIFERADWITPKVRDAYYGWRGLGEAEYLAWTDVGKTWKDAMKEAKARGMAMRGRLQGPDALTARAALTVLRLGDPPDAILLLRDADNQPTRLEGLKQARDEMPPAIRDRIVIGFAVAKRESWVLAGFVPQDDEEELRLEALRRELGFDPCKSPERLDATKETAKRSAKRVLGCLTNDDFDREILCSSETPLPTLAERGHANGLRDYLHEVCERIVPLLAPDSPTDCEQYA